MLNVKSIYVKKLYRKYCIYIYIYIYLYIYIFIYIYIYIIRYIVYIHIIKLLIHFKKKFNF